MKNFWLKIGCFLTGHNYSIVRASSEATAKTVKKYLSAMLIVIIIWGFVGFAFTRRYLHGNYLVSALGSLVMIVIVIQIERQIILSLGKNHWMKLFRIMIGLVIALVGSVIIDQIIFREDINRGKISDIQEKVNRILPAKARQLDYQIAQIDTAMATKDRERSEILAEVTLRPSISMPIINTYEQKDSTGALVTSSRTVTNQSVPNPKAELLPAIDTQIENLRKEKTMLEMRKLSMREDLEKEFRSTVGFIEELNVLEKILAENGNALVVWILFLILFISMELFVLFNKYGDLSTDYDKAVLHQMQVKIRMLEKMGEPGNSGQQGKSRE